MTKLGCLFFCIFSTSVAHGGFANPNSVLMGEKAAGMGGAATALSDDPAAGPFYNPAALARMKGSSLSASINAYHKYDTQYGELQDFGSAPLRVNRGSIVPIPASSGAIYSFGNFALGLSIVFPDFEIYSGTIRATENSYSYLTIRDESLWVGGNLAFNLSEKSALGLTMYYTSRTYNRSVTDQSEVGANTAITSEEKAFYQNSLVYILGFFHQFNSNWSLGLSYRPPSLPISSQGTYFKSVINTGTGVTPPVSQVGLNAETLVPARLGFGLAYTQKRKLSVAFDLHHYASTRYLDLPENSGGDLIEHKSIVNASLGAEYYTRDWLAFRTGLYTNFSTHPEIPDDADKRKGDHVDMWGFSTNVAIHTSPQTTFSLGGYYSGGTGHSVQELDQSLQKLKKSIQIFSFLVGTSYSF